MRERCHPFNTARMVARALTKCRLLVDHNSRLAERLTLSPRAGLLYPGADSMLLDDVPLEHKPEQLVILDGTWHHAKTLVRDIPALANLPRYGLSPETPGRYRIRREPTPFALSTVEATVAALDALEPDTVGLDRLLAAFDTMVERQLAHPKAEYGWRQKASRGRTFRNIPLALLGDLRNIVVAYGESLPGERGCKLPRREPVAWVAERLGTGERFACTIRQDAPLPDAFFAHLELTADDFAHALTMDEARQAWSSFARPGDTVAVYNQGPADLFARIAPHAPASLVLKSVDLPAHVRNRTLDELLVAEGLRSDPPLVPGRAGKRLANLAVWVQHLHVLGRAARC